MANAAKIQSLSLPGLKINMTTETLINIIDIILIFLIFISALQAYNHGLVYTVLSLLAWLGMLIIGLTFLYPLALLLAMFIPFWDSCLFIALLSLFMVSFFILNWINYLIIDSLGRLLLSEEDRIIAFILGLLRAGVGILCLLLPFGLFLGITQTLWWQNSLIIQQISQIIIFILQLLPSIVAKQFYF